MKAVGWVFIRTMKIEDQRNLEYAMGYLELGMTQDAAHALEQIEASSQKLSSVLEVRLAVLMQSQCWKEAVELAKELVVRNPDQVESFIQWAYATRRATSIESAKEILAEAAKRFPKAAIVHYNLGCYEAQLGNRENAMDRLRRAIRIDRSFRSIAKKDSDLNPIHEFIDEI